MKTPFTTEQFFKVFENYNSTVFPFQLIIVLLGFTVLFLLHSKIPFKNKLIGCYLGVLWIWIGLVYHVIYFTEINKAAYVFGGIFILQGLLILLNTLVRGKLVFSFNRQFKDYTGYFFIIFGLLIYPVIGYLVEGSFIRTIALGLPCPTTIFTFGFLMLTDNKFPKYLLIIPSLWAIIGLSAAVNFGVYQDFMLIISAIIAGIFLIKRKN
jgi:hypothetical protein